MSKYLLSLVSFGFLALQSSVEATVQPAASVSLSGLASLGWTFAGDSVTFRVKAALPAYVRPSHGPCGPCLARPVSPAVPTRCCLCAFTPACVSV